MNTVITIRFASGREERYGFDLGEVADPEMNLERLRELTERQTLVLRVQDEGLENEDELRIIPLQTVECITFGLPITEARTPGVVYVRRLP